MGLLDRVIDERDIGVALGGRFDRRLHLCPFGIEAVQAADRPLELLHHASGARPTAAARGSVRRGSDRQPARGARTGGVEFDGDGIGLRLTGRA
ncbi:MULTISPECIES: hypothetical protein [unclassified Natrinema]|uniref:hypothetical protein n=1 Tax=unclassified Natrinema TaxID=2622230 RepID=UPI00026D42EA|nr:MULTISPECIES: hypothetical protein [unclassified Natrinema]AFO55432.1 hypothetical protein NJ7G_0177 [Natrinema sp. J7-2]